MGNPSETSFYFVLFSLLFPAADCPSHGSGDHHRSHSLSALTPHRIHSSLHIICSPQKKNSSAKRVACAPIDVNRTTYCCFPLPFPSRYPGPRIIERSFPTTPHKRMTCKRRNHGRSKHSRGRTTPVHCFNCGRLTPKDKAVKRFVVRNMLDQASARDVAENSTVYNTGFPLPKLYMKTRYCIACAIHSRVVRGRAVVDRKKRTTGKKPFKAAKKE